MAGLMEQQVGAWGAGFISIGLIISLLGALIAWVLLCAEILRIPAQDAVMPNCSAGRTPTAHPRRRCG